MNIDSHWQRNLIASLHLESLFDAAQFGILAPPGGAVIKPQPLETSRAVANIKEWRAYLPEACVAAMIRDGWQWST